MVNHNESETAHLGQFSQPSHLGVGAPFHRDPNLITYNDKNTRGVMPSSRATGLNLVIGPAQKKPAHTIGEFLPSPQSGAQYYQTAPYEMRPNRGIINILGAKKLLYRNPDHDKIRDMHKAPFAPAPISTKRHRGGEDPSGMYLGEVTAGDLEHARNARTLPYMSDRLRQILPGKGKQGGPGNPDITLGPMPEYMYDGYADQNRVVKEMVLGMGGGFRSSTPNSAATTHEKRFGPQRKIGGMFQNDIYTDPRPATVPVYSKTKHPKNMSFSAPATPGGPKPLQGTLSPFPEYMSSPYLDNPWKNLSSIERRATNKLQFKTGKAVGSQKTVNGTLDRKIIRPIANNRAYCTMESI